jgi:hypothetical protein
MSTTTKAASTDGWAAMLPKSATTADVFLAGGENRDGRNTIVAVLDTGVGGDKP